MDFQDHYASNGDVRIHYVAAGEGPLVVMIHGFPDFWATWRPLMEALQGRWRTAAMDLRGYNLSDKPEGEAAYAMPNLVADVAAVIRAEGRASAVVIGHDWGAAIAWQVAIYLPQIVDRLVILSTPHPVGFRREMAANPEQQSGSQYARNFQQPGYEKNLSAEALTFWVRAEAKAEWTAALERSDFTAMLNYYRMNYPRGTEAPEPRADPAPVRAPVLVIHGLKDTALQAAGHSGTWDHVQADTTLLMIPDAEHWVHRDAETLVNRTIRDWLEARR